MGEEREGREYRAFISYSHADRKWADWLHRAIETYPVPKDLVGKLTPWGDERPGRIFPVFRDRDELPSSNDLGGVIEQALRRTRFLIVICSPRSAKSQWVNQEIVRFKQLHGEERILCLIVDGEPWASDGKVGVGGDDECFPEAVRHRLGEDGVLSGERCEPIAADAREGKDGKGNALIKLAAGLLGVGFDDLRRREAEYQRRRIRRLQALVAGFALLFVAAVAAGAYAVVQKRSVQRALSQSDLQLALQARDEGDFSRAAVHLARSLRSNPENRTAADATWSLLAHHTRHVPVGAAMRHPGEVSAAVGSADGRFVLTASGAEVFRWERPENRLGGRVSPDGSAVLAMSEVPGGGFVAVATEAGVVHFLNSATLEEHRPRLDLVGKRVMAMVWGPGGEELAFCLLRRGVRESGEVVVFGLDGVERARRAVGEQIGTLMDWSDDGGWLAFGGSGPKIFTLPYRDGKLGEPVIHQVKLMVSGLAFLTDGKLRTNSLMEGLVDRDPATGEVVGEAREVSPAAIRSAFSGDGELVLACRMNRQAMVRRGSEEGLLGEPLVAAFTIVGGVFLDDDHVLIHGFEGEAQVIRIRKNHPPAVPMVHRKLFPEWLAVSPDCLTAAVTGLNEDRVHFWDLASGERAARPVKFPVDVGSLGFDGDWIVALGVDGHVYRVKWRRAVEVLKSESRVIAPPEDVRGGWAQAYSISPDGRRMLAVVRGDVSLLDLADGSVLKKVGMEEEMIYQASWMPEGVGFHVVSDSGRVVFHEADGEVSKRWAEISLSERVVGVSVRQDLTRVAVMSASDRVTVHDLESGRLVGPVFAVGPGTVQLAWSLDGRHLAGGDVTHTIGIWEVDSGFQVGRFRSLLGNGLDVITALKDGRMLISDGPALGLLDVAFRSTPPSWIPDFLDGLAGETLEGGGGGSPDGWRSALAAAGRDGDDEWGSVARWMFEDGKGRKCAPGEGMAEVEAEWRLSTETREKEARGLGLEFQSVVESGDEAALAMLLPRVRDACLAFPENRELQLGWLSLAANQEDAAGMREAWLAIAASGESSLLEEMEAKALAALVSLDLEPPDVDMARRLSDEVLDFLPGEANALMVRERVGREGR
jgi:WD40 repeat protein